MVVGDVSDMDECLGEVSNDCSAAADCLNTAGSYSCHCKPGYGGDGINCSGVDMRLLITVSSYQLHAGQTLHYTKYLYMKNMD